MYNANYSSNHITVVRLFHEYDSFDHGRISWRPVKKSWSFWRCQQNEGQSVIIFWMLHFDWWSKKLYSWKSRTTVILNFFKNIYILGVRFDPFSKSGCLICVNSGYSGMCCSQHTHTILDVTSKGGGAGARHIIAFIIQKIKSQTTMNQSGFSDWPVYPGVPSFQRTMRPHHTTHLTWFFFVIEHQKEYRQSNNGMMCFTTWIGSNFDRGKKNDSNATSFKSATFSRVRLLRPWPDIVAAHEKVFFCLALPTKVRTKCNTCNGRYIWKSCRKTRTLEQVTPPRL